MQALNKLERYKGAQQSQFRVHFYLRNIPYDPKLKPEAFIQNITKQISESLKVAIIQISTSIKTQVDVSVALANDHIACQFIESGKKIFLQAQNNGTIQIEPKISDAFRSYYLNWKSKIKKIRQAQDIREMRKTSKDYQQFQDYRKKYKANSSEDYKRRQTEQSSRKKCLWIFCIPLQFKERQVCSILQQHNITIKSYSWKSQQDMEFLEVDLHQPLLLKQVQKFDIKIDKYPLLVIAKPQLSVNQVLIEYQVQLSFDKQIDQIELIRFVTAVQGVICMIKDEFYGPRKYVVALNTILKTNRITEKAQKELKYCHVGKPTYILRLGRLQKSFTFTQTIQNLQFYQDQLARNKQTDF